MNEQPTVWQTRQTEILTQPNDVVEVILSGRDYSDDQLATLRAPDFGKLADPMLLHGMSQATNRIERAISSKQRVVIYGDYDIDGISATALLLDALSQFGAQVQSYIPDRFEEGYGLNDEAIRTLKTTGADLVITVDCGISASAQISLAKQIGLDLIVTDHHTVPPKLPKGAIALINPKLSRSRYPFRELSGVGVAFALVRALQQLLPTKMPPGQEKWLLDLVALGTICDQVPLVGENWLMARYGLTVLQKTRRVGLRALLKIAGVQASSIDESSVGFRLGPRLNAAGRIEHANVALRLLSTTSPVEADRLATQLNSLNQDRQRQTQLIYEQALAQARAQNLPTVVLADPNWSHGVVGIVASRVSETLHKPTILLQVEDNVARGSARSIGEFNIIEAITAAAKHLQRYGGHQFAAGVTLKLDQLDDFHLILNDCYERFDQTKQPIFMIDAQLSPQLLLDNKLVMALEDLRPFGKDHSQPLFVSRLKLAYARPVGDKHQHIRLGFEPEEQSRGQQRQVNAIYFNGASAMADFQPGQLLEVPFSLEINHWQNRQEPQLVLAASPRPV